MNDKSLLKNITFVSLLILALILFVFTIFDILLDWGFSVYLVLGNVLILVLLILSMIIFYSKQFIPISVNEFEKSLSGGLFHFKCPVCGGIFAIKKSKGNKGIITKMTCPDCGVIGVIPKNPVSVVEEIPEKKSLKANFRCKNCGEGVTVWAEGSDLYNDTKVLICPFCHHKKTLQKF